MVEPIKAATSPNPRKGPRLWGWHTGLSVVIALAILVSLIVVKKIDPKEIWHDVTGLKLGFVLLGAWRTMPPTRFEAAAGDAA